MDEDLFKHLEQDTQCGSTLHSRYDFPGECQKTHKTEEHLVSQRSRGAGLPVHSPWAFLWFDVQFVVIDVNFGDVHFKEIGL